MAASFFGQSRRMCRSHRQRDAASCPQRRKFQRMSNNGSVSHVTKFLVCVPCPRAMAASWSFCVRFVVDHLVLHLCGVRTCVFSFGGVSGGGGVRSSGVRGPVPPPGPPLLCQPVCVCASWFPWLFLMIPCYSLLFFAFPCYSFLL